MIEKNILDSSSEIYSNNFDIYFIDLKFEDMFPDFEDYQISLDDYKANELILNFENYIVNLLDNIRNNFNGNIFIGSPKLY